MSYNDKDGLSSFPARAPLLPSYATGSRSSRAPTKAYSTQSSNSLGGSIAGWSRTMGGRGGGLGKRWAVVLGTFGVLFVLNVFIFHIGEDDVEYGRPPSRFDDVPPPYLSNPKALDAFLPVDTPPLPLTPFVPPVDVDAPPQRVAPPPPTRPQGAPPQAPPVDLPLLLKPPVGADRTYQPVPVLEDAELPFLEPQSAFVQPRRPILPASPNPWAHVLEKNAAWQGFEWLERFKGGKNRRDPPREDRPPADYLTKAYEFKARARPYLRYGPQSTVQYDDMGRAKQVPREDMYLGGDTWVGPTLKVSELGKSVRGRVGVENVQMPEKKMMDGREREESDRREWVKLAFVHAWEGYKELAWGHDELRPVSGYFSDHYNGWGATIVDCLDLLLIMDLPHEYAHARSHVKAIDFTYLVPSGDATFSNDLPPLSDLSLPPPENDEDGTYKMVAPSMGFGDRDYRSPQTIPLFETVIRYLGGLISAYDLSSDPLMLTRAVELGDWLLPSMGTQFGLAVGRYEMGTNPNGAGAGRSVLSEVGSLSLEFTRLSMISGDEVYYQAVQRSMDTLDTHFKAAMNATERIGRPVATLNRYGSLLPSYIDGAQPSGTYGHVGFGGESDSYYEYLIKQHHLLGEVTDQYKRMYTEAIDSAYEFLVKKVEVVPGRPELLIAGDHNYGMFSATLSHLACFAGGMFGLGAKLLGSVRDLDTAEGITEACAWAYESSASGLGPESLLFYEPKDPSRYVVVDGPGGVGKFRKPRVSNGVAGIKHSSAHYIGRPETIESVFYMYRITGDRKWQDQGWKMFTAWVEHAITENGFASIGNVYSTVPPKMDSMESFVLAETIKYYYLLFSPTDVISLDEYVFNTEAHPFRIPTRATAPPPIWTGPDALAPPVIATTGTGTVVQEWARVQQAANLAKAEVDYLTKQRAEQRDAVPAPAPPPQPPTRVLVTDENLERELSEMELQRAALRVDHSPPPPPIVRTSPARVQRFEEPIDTRSVVAAPGEEEELFTSDLGDEVSVLEVGGPRRKDEAGRDGEGQGGDSNGT